MSYLLKYNIIPQSLLKAQLCGCRMSSLSEAMIANLNTHPKHRITCHVKITKSNTKPECQMKNNEYTLSALLQMLLRIKIRPRTLSIELLDHAVPSYCQASAYVSNTDTNSRTTILIAEQKFQIITPNLTYACLLYRTGPVIVGHQSYMGNRASIVEAKGNQILVLYFQRIKHGSKCFVYVLTYSKQMFYKCIDFIELTPGSKLSISEKFERICHQL